nr:putative membrane protein [Cedratvirus lena]
MELVNEAARFSSKVDVITAAQYLEKTIHAKNKDKVVYYLLKARTQLTYAQTHLEDISNDALAGSTAELIKELDTLSKEAEKLDRKSLAKFQERDLQPFQGLLGALYLELN